MSSAIDNFYITPACNTAGADSHPAGIDNFRCGVGATTAGADNHPAGIDNFYYTNASIVAVIPLAGIGNFCYTNASITAVIPPAGIDNFYPQTDLWVKSSLNSPAGIDNFRVTAGGNTAGADSHPTNVRQACRDARMEWA